MKRTLFVIVASLFLAFVISSCEDTPTISDIVEYSTPTIKGTITIPDGSDVKPDEVYVKVIDSDDKAVTIQKASSDGTFVIQNLSQDMTYKILFTSEEPEFNNRSVTRGKGSGVGGWLKDVVPAVKEGNNVGSVKMKPLGTIKGRVTVDGKTEHYDTTVYIPGTSYSAITDKDGNFSIFSVPEGTYTLRYTHEDCVAYMMQNVMLVCPDDVENPEKTVGNVVLRSSRGTVQGKAVLGDADDSTGITIKLESEDKSTSYDSSTSSNGNYTINGVTPGRYRVIASYSTYLSQSTGYFDVSAATVTSVPEQLELLGDYGKIKGYASLSDSEKKEGIQILISSTDGTNSYSVLTDNDGSFTKIVKPGQYSITALSPDYTSQTKTLTVVQDKTVEISFSPLTNAYGSISGSTCSPNEFVSLLDSANIAVKTVQTGSDCTFSFLYLSPGTYSLNISKEGHFSTSVPNVYVEAGEETKVTTPSLVVSDGIVTGAVSGFVMLEGGSSNGGVTITLTDSSNSGNKFVGISGDDGSFRISGIEKTGTYLLTYSKDGYVSDLSNSVDITVGKISIASSVTLKSVMSTVSGSVQLEGSASHENITVLLHNDISQYMSTTDTKGEYRINGVNPGTYTLTASKDGYVSASSNEFVVGPASEKDVEDLTLGIAIRSITGTVKLELLTDYAGALVTATNLADSTKVYSAITNSAGVYTLAGMTPGEYQIVISYNGYRTATLPTVNVVSSTMTTIALTEMQINRGTITGVAKLEGRSSSKGVAVELLRGSDVYETTTTDESGSYSFYVPQGNYTGVRYTMTDFASSSVSKDIALFVDNYFSMGNETLKATHNSVYGTVDVLTTDDESEVTISFDGVTTIQAYVTQTDGSFRFDHVPVGSYTLRFQRQDCSDITIPVEVQAADGINLGKIEVTPNTATIKGKVNLENGTNLKGVKVSVDLGTKVLETTTDDSGRYEIGGISIADEYTVTYSKDGWNSKTQLISPKLSILEARELDEVTLVDTTAPVLSSVVINSGANTTANKVVTLNLSASDTGNEVAEIMITYDGVFDKSTRRYEYSPIFEWELPAVNGIHTIYVRVIDKAGNESDSCSAAVTLTDQKTEVSGVLTDSELVWTVDKSPYLVAGSVMVEEGTTLTIEPGVDVQFAGSYGITVEGTIKAVGTEDEKISFYGVDEGENNWLGIDCRNNNGNMLKYVTLDGGKKSLQGAMSVFNSVIDSDEYALFNFTGEVDDSRLTGGLFVKGGTLLHNEIELKAPSLSNGTYINMYIPRNYRAYYSNLLGDTYCSGNIFKNGSLLFGGISENNLFKDMNLILATSNLNTTFDNCELSIIGYFLYDDNSYEDVSHSGTYIMCEFDSCSFSDFNPSLIIDSNFVNSSSSIKITTKFSDYEELDLSGNFWGYANTKELQKYGLKAKHSFIEDYFSDSEFSITRADLSDFRTEPNEQAGYKGDSYYDYPEESTIEYAIGSTGPAGGIVFYDKGYYSNGWRYLESAPADVDSAEHIFGYYKATLNSTPRVIGTSEVIGSGKLNTDLITTVMGDSAYIKDDARGDTITDYAAKMCSDFSYGGYSDWFLPSKDELNLMYVNLYKNGIGNLSGWYSSSSWRNDLRVWTQYFVDGDQYSSPRDDDYSVRAIRYF